MTQKWITVFDLYKSYFASYNSNSRGVANLFNNNLEFLVKKSVQEYLRKLHICYCNNNGLGFFDSLYGPNRDDPEFYAELEERINDVGFENYYWR